ncbi:MAG: alpha/beta fold hydrolase, partial [Gammaproteobacteria bacterium]
SAQAALFEKALTRLRVEQPVVLGHSWGTLVALAMALDYPQKVRGLVLVSGYYYPTARLDVAMTAPVALPVLGDVMRYTVSPVFGRLAFRKTIEVMFAPRPVPDRFRETLSREMMLRPSQIRANAEDAAFMIPAAARFEYRYPTLQVPVRILAGAEDRVVDTQEQAARLRAELPQSKLRVFQNIGHMVHYAALDATVAAVEELAEGSTSAPRAAAA